MKVVVTGLSHPLNRQPSTATDNRGLGASGVLGNAVYKAYKLATDHDLIGLGHSRATDHLKKLDLTNYPETEAFFDTTRPDRELCDISGSHHLTNKPCKA